MNEERPEIAAENGDLRIERPASWSVISVARAIDDYYFGAGGRIKRICRASATAILLGLGMAVTEPILGSRILRELFVLLSAMLQAFGFLIFLPAKMAGCWAGAVSKIDLAVYAFLYFVIWVFVMTHFARP